MIEKSKFPMNREALDPSVFLAGCILGFGAESAASSLTDKIPLVMKLLEAMLVTILG